MRIIANILISLGLTLGSLAFATLVYSAWLETQYAAWHSDEPTAQPQASAIQLRTPIIEPRMPLAAATRDELPTLDRATLGEPAERAGYGQPLRLRIPSAEVNTRVMEVGVKGGEYEVPAWEAGFHQDSAELGLGNSVLTGHLETINAGRVFARLYRIEPSDTFTIDSATHRTVWMVTEREEVPRDQHDYILPSGDTRVTLYTCAGRWDPLARDYTERLVITGRLVESLPLP